MSKHGLYLKVGSTLQSYAISEKYLQMAIIIWFWLKYAFLKHRIRPIDKEIRQLNFKTKNICEVLWKGVRFIRIFLLEPSFHFITKYSIIYLLIRN